MQVTEAISTVKTSALWNNSYSDEEVGRAIRAITNDFVNVTGCTRTTANVPTVASNALVNPVTSISAFRLGQLESVVIGNKRLIPIGLETISRKLETDTSTASPTYFHIKAPTVMYLWNIPNSIYTMEFTYAPSASTWTLGSPSGSLNIPDEYVDTPLWLGAAAFLVWGEADARYSSTEYSAYVAYRTAVRDQVGFKPLYQTRRVPAEQAA